MAGTTMAADGGLGDITNLLNLVKDQKSSSTVTTGISKEGVTQQINDILQGTSGLASVAGAQKTAGLYNSSTNTQLTNDLLARASAQVAARNAPVTTSQTKKASVTKQNIEGILASTALRKVLGSDTVTKGAKDVYGSIADELGIATGTNDTATANALSSVSGAGPGAQVGDFTSLESSLAGGTSGVGSDIGAGSASALADTVTGTGVAAQAGDTSVAGLEALDSAAAAGTAGATAAQVASFGAGTEAGAAGAAADFGLAGEATTAGVTTGETAAGLAAGEVGAEAGLGTALGATGIGLALTPLVGGIAKAIGSGDVNDVGDVYGQFGHWVGDRLQSTGDAIGQAAKDVTGWIVCTELLRQGKFNRRHYAAGLRVFESYPRHLLCGYYIWAIPLVSALRRNPNSWYSGLVRHLFAERAEYLAARAGVSGARDTAYGQYISGLMFGTCWLLGHGLNLWSSTVKAKRHSHGN